MKKFIFTQDERTKTELLNLGYRLLRSNNTMYIFENSNKLTFSKKDKDFKYVLSNTMFF